MDLVELRTQFPVTQQYAYLNHASVAALPTPVIDSMGRYLAARGHGIDKHLDVFVSISEDMLLA